MALRIRIEHGQDAGKTWRLAVPGIYRFGRSPRGSVQILDMKVSKEHFEIHVDEQAGRIHDLGSTHGTLLNQQRVPAEPKALSPGDELRAGLTVLRVLSDGPADEEARPCAPLPDGAAPAGAPAAAAGGPAPEARPTQGGAARPGARGNDPLVGTVLGGYRLLERVGAGGMGAVYRAEQLSLHREVALKVLSERLVSDSAFVDQFVNEARAAGQLNHPNVVQVYDVGQVDGRHYFSMEYIEGGSLEDKIPKGTAGVPWQDALPWFLDAANALIFAEKKGILHRDIKPDNLMIGQDGSVKLCDLGLAKKSESADLLAQGIIGTPHFIAPEAIRRKTEVDGRADLYSLGCSYYRILTGRNPFPAPTVKEILLAHLNAPVPRVSAQVPDVARDVDDVVFRLMQKDPAERFASAEDLWKALDRIRVQHGMEAHGLHPGRAKKLAFAGVGVAVAAIGTLIYLKPWESKVTTVTKEIVTEKTTGVSAAELNAEKATSALLKVKTDAVDALGRFEDGENWKKAGWDGVVARLEAVAREFAGTEAADQATKEAERIQKGRAQRREAADSLAQAGKRAREALAAAAKAGAEKAAAAATPLEAEAAIEEALVAVRAAGKAAHEGQALLAPAEVTREVDALEARRRDLAGGVREAFAVVEAQAKEKLKPATSTALDEGAAAYDAFLASHPEAKGTGEVAQAWNAARDAAKKAAEEIRGRQTDVRRRDVVADRRAYFDWLVKEAFAPRSEDGTSGGDYASFRFADAAQKAERAQAAAKTPEYRALLAARAAEARLAAKLPEILVSGFASKGFKDKLAGTNWNGTPKSFTAVGVQVGEKLRPYADEGLGWFLDLFFEKAQERYPLDADGWEGLGVVAEAATVLESAARGEVAAAAWQKAIDLDPARSERLTRRIAQAREEARVRLLLDESDGLVASTVAEIAKYEGEIADTSDMKKAEKARNEVLGKEAALRKGLEDARARLQEVERGHAATVGRALLGDAPPALAAYAGEALPPAAPPPAPPAPPAEAGMGGSGDGPGEK